MQFGTYWTDNLIHKHRTKAERLISSRDIEQKVIEGVRILFGLLKFYQEEGIDHKELDELNRLACLATATLSNRYIAQGRNYFDVGDVSKGYQYFNSSIYFFEKFLDYSTPDNKYCEQIKKQKDDIEDHLIKIYQDNSITHSAASMVYLEDIQIPYDLRKFTKIKTPQQYRPSPHLLGNDDIQDLSKEEIIKMIALRR